MKRILSILLLLFLAFPLYAQVMPKSAQELRLEAEGYIDIHTLNKSIVVELKYATTDNFTKVVLYDSITHAYLHPLAAEKLCKAQKYLKEVKPKYSLVVYDAARPLTVQWKMFNVVKGTSQEPYVANPSRTGLHNYGMAVDLSVLDETGEPLDMGTIFDFLGLAAGIANEEQLVMQGILTRKHVENRKLLRDAMVKGGFTPIRGEWWHFNAVSLKRAKANYKVIP